MYIDNFYTSVTLFHELLNMKTNVCRTVRVNHMLLHYTVKLPKIRIRESVSRWSVDGELLCMKWVEKKSKEKAAATVLLLSNLHKAQFVNMKDLWDQATSHH